MQKQQLLVNKPGILSFTYRENGIPVAITDPKITIYNNAGTEKLAQIAATTPSVGVMSYDVAAALIPTIDVSWRANWEFKVGAVTKYEEQLFDIVNQILNNPVITSDIIGRAPFLDDQNYRQVFTSEGGSSNTIESAELIQDANWWTNGAVEITGGTNAGTTRKVIDFVNAVLTVSPSYGEDIIDDSICNVIRSYEKEIIEAFDIFLVDLKKFNLKSNRMIGSEQIREFVINKTIELVCGNFTKDIADIWNLREDKFKGKYDELFNNPIFDYDRNNDGDIGESESDRSYGQVPGVR